MTLRELLAQHPDWADAPVKVYTEKNCGVINGVCHVEPLVYYYKPTVGEEGHGNPAVECLVFSAGD